MNHSHRTQAQKRITNLINNFDRFPANGQIKIAVVFYRQLQQMIFHKKNAAMQNWRF